MCGGGLDKPHLRFYLEGGDCGEGNSSIDSSKSTSRNPGNKECRPNPLTPSRFPASRLVWLRAWESPSGWNCWHLPVIISFDASWEPRRSSWHLCRALAQRDHLLFSGGKKAPRALCWPLICETPGSKMGWTTVRAGQEWKGLK